MITTKDLENLGWIHVATASNGGSDIFTSKNRHYELEVNFNNFIYQTNNDSKLNEIVIRRFFKKNNIWTDEEVYCGQVNNIDEFKLITKEFFTENIIICKR